jgi:hypothetical protein
MRTSVRTYRKIEIICLGRGRKMNDKNKGSMRQILACVVFIFAGIATAQEREWGVDREIVQVSESVYRWGSDNQYGAYIAGSDGIAVVDGHYCPSGTMRWLYE